RNPIAKLARQDVRIFSHPVGQLSIAQVPCPHRNIPMKDGGERLHPQLEHPIEHPIVGINAFFANGTSLLGLNTGPSKRKSEGLHPGIRKQTKIVHKPIFKIGIHNIRSAIPHVLALIQKNIPITWTPSLTTFYLAGSRTNPPFKTLRKFASLGRNHSWQTGGKR